MAERLAVRVAVLAEVGSTESDKDHDLGGVLATHKPGDWVASRRPVEASRYSREMWAAWQRTVGMWTRRVR